MYSTRKMSGHLEERETKLRKAVAKVAKVAKVVEVAEAAEVVAAVAVAAAAAPVHAASRGVPAAPARAEYFRQRCETPLV
jgi:hypothetical protein